MALFYYCLAHELIILALGYCAPLTWHVLMHVIWQQLASNPVPFILVVKGIGEQLKNILARPCLLHLVNQLIFTL